MSYVNVRTNNFGTEKCVSDVVTTISKYLRTAEALQLAILSNTPPHRRFSLTGFISKMTSEYQKKIDIFSFAIKVL